MKSKNQYLNGAIISYINIGVHILSGLIYTPWMIKTIGEDHFALYTVATSIVGIFLLDFGIGSAVSKFLSNYYANNDYKKANEFLGIVYEVFICVSIIIAFCLVVFYLFINKIYSSFSLENLILFKKIFIIVSSYSLLLFPFSVFNGILNANEQFGWLKLCTLLQSVLNVILIVLCLSLKLGVFSLVLVHGFTSFIITVLKYILIKVKTKTKTVFFIKNKYVIKDLVDFCLFSTINSISQRFIFNIMPTIIALFADNEAVTMFSIATTLEGYVFTFSQAVNGMFLPKISRINVSENQHEKLNSLMIKVGTFHIYTLGLLYIGFLLLGKDFISMWLGEGYFLVYACALLLMLPSLIDTPQQIARTALVVKNYMKEQSFIYVCMAVLNVLFSLVLVVRFKLIGAAISIVLAYLVRTILFNILYFYKLKINLKEYFKNVYSKWLGIGLLTVFLYSITFRLIPFEGLVFFLIKGISIVCIYAVLFVLFNRELVSKFVSNYYKNGGN